MDLGLTIVLANAPCYVGVNKGETQLLAKVNQIIKQAKADGYIDKLSMEWLGAPAGISAGIEVPIRTRLV